MKRIIILLLLGILQHATAQELYKAADIPSTLKPRANAVIRNMETTVDMRSPEHVVILVKQAVTVLNKNGDSDGGLYIYYNKNSSIKGIKGEIYDEFGTQIRKFTQNNFKDESAISNFSLFEDDRIKYFEPQMIQYPYTVVYEYELRNKQNLIIPDWYVNPAPAVAVERNSYRFICKTGDKVTLSLIILRKTEQRPRMKSWFTTTGKQRTFWLTVQNLIHSLPIFSSPTLKLHLKNFLTLTPQENTTTGMN